MTRPQAVLPPAGSEGWIQTVVLKALNHSVVYGLSVGLLPLTNLLLLPIYTRHLSPEAFGVLALLMVTSGVLSFLYDLGMINALFRRYFDHTPEAADDRRTVLSTAWMFMTVHAAVWAVVLLIAAHWLPPVGAQGHITGVVRLMVLSTLVNACADVPAAVLRLRERVRTFALVCLLRSGVLIAVTYTLVAVRGRGLAGVFESSLVAGGSALIPLVALTAREYAARVSWAEFTAMVKFGLPFFPVLFFTWIIDFSDRYFLGILSTLDEVGVYTVGYKIGQIVLLAVKAFMVAWIPLMFSIARKPQAPEAFAKVFRYYLLGLSVLGLSIVLWRGELVGFVAPASYHRAADIVPLVVAAYLCYGLYSFMLSGLLVTRDVWVQPATLATAAGLNAVLNWWWIPSFGMWGAAWATIVSYSFAAVATWAASQRRYPIPVEGRRLCLMLGGALVFAVVATWYHLPGAGKILLLGLYGGLLCAAHVVSPGEVRTLTGMLTRFRSVPSDAALAAD